ncbi:MAG: hypothetical protein AAF821_24560 [Cyanobacteria bacterium P01_D01_bin.156]
MTLLLQNVRLICCLSLQTFFCSLLFTLASSALAHDTQCQEPGEFFGFKLENYAIEHQGGVTVDIDVAYRLMASYDADYSDYPDFLPILRDTQQFIGEYSNETDYWEMLNRNLVEHLLDKYQQLAALRVGITILPEELSLFEPVRYENYERFSVVTATRPDVCFAH